MTSSIHSAGLASAGMEGAPFLSKYSIKLDALSPKSKRGQYRSSTCLCMQPGRQSRTTKKDSFTSWSNQEETIELVEEDS